MWKLINTLLNNQQGQRRHHKENQKIVKRQKKTKTQNTKNLYEIQGRPYVLRGKCTAVNAFIKKEETSQINNLTLYLEELEWQKKDEQTKPKPSRRKVIITIREEINKIENK